jgi:hypothetical protein
MLKFNLPMASFLGTLFFGLSMIIPAGSYAQDKMDQITFHTGNNNKGKNPWQTLCGKLVKFNESQVEFQFMVETGYLLPETKPIHISRINFIRFGSLDWNSCKKDSQTNKVDKNAVKNIVAQAMSPPAPTTWDEQSDVNTHYPMGVPMNLDAHPVALVYFTGNNADYLKSQGCYVVSSDNPDTSKYAPYFYGFPRKYNINTQDGQVEVSFACLQSDQRNKNIVSKRSSLVSMRLSFLKLFFQYGRNLR